MPRRHVVIARPVNRLKIYGLSGPTTLPLEHMPSHYKADLRLILTTLRCSNFATPKNDFQCRQVLYRPVKRFERGYVTTGISIPDGNDHPESQEASLQAITAEKHSRHVAAGGSGAGRASPADERPLVTEAFHTADLPPLPQRDRRMPASLWVEAPDELRHLGAALGYEVVAYKRRIGRWLLWRAGPAVGAAARYGAVDVNDLGRLFTFELDAEGMGHGVGPDNSTHTRFRSWKEALRDT